MTRHHFTPSAYYNTFATRPPALVIHPGDSVYTTTLDAHGFDSGGSQPATRPNPLTGPFFVEGAESGDTLAVRLDRLAPNRTTGWSYATLRPNLVDPDFARQLPPRQSIDWEVDVRQGCVRLAQPPPGLPALELPLEPMLGCLGVAPAGGEAITSATCGPFGGNLDYRRLTEGVTLYLPVSAPGALLYIGDAHARQCDGEITGAGVEVSFEVTFTTTLLKKKRIAWPRGESAEAIFTIGCARPLDQALQHATTEMLRWLMEDFGLELISAGTLLSQAAQYELGNFVSADYSMACRLPRHLLTKVAS